MIGISVELPLLPPHSLILSPSVCLVSRLCKVSVFSCTQWLLFLHHSIALCVSQVGLQLTKTTSQTASISPLSFFFPFLSVLSSLNDLRYVYVITCTKIALFLCFPSFYVISSLRSTAGSRHLQHHTKPRLLSLCLCVLFFIMCFPLGLHNRMDNLKGPLFVLVSFLCCCI